MDVPSAVSTGNNKMVQLLTIPFISKYKLSNSVPLGLGSVMLAGTLILLSFSSSISISSSSTTG